MEYELIHDTIAKQVFEKASTEARSRRKVEKYIRERYEAYKQRGAKLTQDDVDFISPYLAQVNILKEEEQFIDDGKRALKAAKRKRQMIAVAIGLLLVAGAGISAYYAIENLRNFNEAQIAEKKADSTAQVAEQKAEEALQARAEADASALIAQQEKLKADSTAKVAQQALTNLQSATASVVKAVLDDAKQDIYKLRYSEARQKYLDAAKLGELPGEVSKGMMELAFFYGESGKRKDALLLAEKALKLRPHPEANTHLAQARQAGKNYRPHLQQFLELMDNTWYDTINRRYYPHMIQVNDTASIAQTETTMWQYHLYCEATGRDAMQRIKPKVSWGLDGDNPIIYVNWYDAARYANWVTKQMGLDTAYVFSGLVELDSIWQDVKAYRLPHERLWEAAAYGGENTTYSGSDTVELVGWHSGNSGSRTHPVAGLRPNALGLYDMSGNVEEWCENWYDNNRVGRVLRGGSWFYYASYLPVAVRNYGHPEYGNDDIGFRLVRKS